MTPGPSFEERDRPRVIPPQTPEERPFVSTRPETDAAAAILVSLAVAAICAGVAVGLWLGWRYGFAVFSGCAFLFAALFALARVRLRATRRSIEEARREAIARHEREGTPVGEEVPR